MNGIATAALTGYRLVIQRILLTVALLGAGYFVFCMVGRVFFVVGQSMYPTLAPGAAVRARTLLAPPNRGDIVVLEDVKGDDCAIKRVVGSPGETIGFFHGHVYINRQLVQEDYLLPHTYTYLPESKKTFTFVEFNLGPADYFVLGDNRMNSMDSRYYGPVHFQRLKAVAMPIQNAPKLSFLPKYIIRNHEKVEIRERPTQRQTSNPHIATSLNPSYR